MSFPDNPEFEPQPAVSAEAQPAATQPPMPSAPDPLAEVPDAAGSAAAVPVAPPPVENPVWSGWDVLLIALLSFVTLIAAELATGMGGRAFFYRHSNLGQVLQEPVVVLLGEFFSYIAVAIYMVMLVEGKYHQPFWQAIRWNWRGNAYVKLLGLGALTVSLNVLSRYLPLPKSAPFDEFFAHPRDAYLVAVFAVSVGPFMEEVFFRGFLYPVLARRTGVTMAVVLTALPFGLLHYLQYRSWAAVLVVGLVGVVLTTVRAVTKSVAASFVVHVGYNGVLMLMTAAATDGFRHMEKAFACVR